MPGAIETLVRFARLVSDANAPADILDALADALVERCNADAVAVVSIDHAGGARLTAERGLPEAAKALTFDPDGIVPDLGRSILAATDGRFAVEQTWPLVASRGLFGAVAVLHTAPHAPAASALADGLVDLAAIALGDAAHIEQLERSYAELRQSQEMLARTEKLRALGQMAAGVSHDMKNILNPLSLHLQLLARTCDSGNVGAAKESIAEMRQVVARGVQILERLRSYSRQSKERKTEIVRLDALAREAASIAKPRMVSGGRLFKIVEDLHDPPEVMAVSAEVVSALVNLVVNAIDAMTATKGSTITLRSGAGGGRCWIEVADDGPGMTKEVEQRVFEPFFTTKGSEGTGLGLATAYACMQRHGGKITLKTAEGEGTTFRLTFPDAAAPESAR